VSSGVGQIDVFATIPSQDGIKFWLAGFAAPIEGYLKDPRLTAPDYDVNDFTAAALQGVKYKGTMFALPWGAEVGMMFYRKDLFQKHEVKVPTTLAELEEAAKKLTLKGADGKIEVFGIANRGRREAVGGGTASAWLHNFGGEWLDKSGNPAVNSPEAVRAWEAYSRVLRLYGPPGQTNFQWYEAASMFAQGRSAIMLDQNVIGVPMFNDPEKSRVVGQVGYAKFPAGPVRDTPNMLTWGLCVTSGSKNKEAAWLLMQWLTNKRQQLRAQMAGSSTARRSSWESQEFRAADKQPEWTRISLQAMASANAEWLPPIVAALEAKEIVGGIIQAGMLGQDVKAAADRAVSDMKRLIEKTEQKP
jgi:multiple sugar transport system substrate-binding protein